MGGDRTKKSPRERGTVRFFFLLSPPPPRREGVSKCIKWYMWESERGGRLGEWTGLVETFWLVGLCMPLDAGAR